METIQCNCPTCGGKLVFDNQSKTMYCPKCDKHFLIDNQSKINLDEKDNNEKVRIDGEKVNIDSEQKIVEPKKSKKVWKIILGIIFFPIVILIAPFYLTWYMIKKDEKRTNKSKIALVSLSWIVWLFVMAIAFIPSVDRKIYLANKYNEVNVGDVLDLSYVIEPESNREVEIAISDDSILKKQDGFYYKAVKEGDVNVALISNNKEYSSYNIKVNEIPLKLIAFKNADTQIDVGDEFIPDIEFSPKDATYPEWSYQSDDNNILEIKGNKIIAKTEGTTTLHVTSNNGLKDEIEVTVVPVLAESIKINGEENLLIGDTAKYDVSFSPINVTDKTIEFLSSDSNIATIDEDGNVLAISEGTVKLTAKTENDIFDEIEVNINPIVAESITIKGDNKLKVGDSAKYTVSFEPSNVTHQNVSLSVDDNSIATIDNEGNLVAKKDGKVVITVQETSNDKKTQKTITITPVYATDIEISAPYDSLYVGGGMNVSVSYAPDNVTYKTVEYSSSDESVATVNEYGYVSAVGEGTARITAKTSNGIKDVLTLGVLSKPIVKTSQANVSGGSTYATTSSDSGSSTMVWISASGKKYHRISSCSNMKNPWQVTLEQAQAQGREACKRCY